MRVNKNQYKFDVATIPKWFIIAIICIIIVALLFVHVLSRGLTDIEIVGFGIYNRWEERRLEVSFEINNTGELLIWNLRMHVTVKNQNNTTILNKEIPIISELPQGEHVYKYFEIKRNENDTRFYIDMEFKWNYFGSKSYSREFRLT